MAKKYDDAIHQYDLALKSDPKYLPGMNAKAFVLIQQYKEGLELDDTQRRSALELLRTSLKINPNQPRIAEALKKWESPGLFGG